MLSNIKTPKDLRLLNQEDLAQLAQELREFIINIVATKQGHLGASLGVVELTIALHYVFNTPEDQLIWDVGHQAYGHKILTGRKDKFHTNRQLKGISGFPKREESIYDAFGWAFFYIHFGRIRNGNCFKIKRRRQTPYRCYW